VFAEALIFDVTPRRHGMYQEDSVLLRASVAIIYP